MHSLKYLVAAGLFMSVAVLGVSGADAPKDKKDDVKLTIKEVMKIAHNKETGLLKKAQDGSITDDEKKRLVAAYTALGTQTPKKGEADSWKKFSDDIAAAAKEYGEGKDEKAAKLTKAAACQSCHKAHK